MFACNWKLEHRWGLLSETVPPAILTELCLKWGASLSFREYVNILRRLFIPEPTVTSTLSDPMVAPAPSLGTCHGDMTARLHYSWKEVNDGKFVWTCTVNGHRVTSARESFYLKEDLALVMNEAESSEQTPQAPSMSLLATMKMTPKTTEDAILCNDNPLNAVFPQLRINVDIANGHLNMRNYTSASQDVYQPTVTSPVSHNYTHHSGKYVRKWFRWKWDCCERRSRDASPCQTGQPNHHYLNYRKSEWPCCHATDRLAAGCTSEISKSYPGRFEWLSSAHNEPLPDDSKLDVYKRSPSTTAAVSLC